MKILFLTNRDLASNYALNLLLPRLVEGHDLHLWLSAKVGNKSSMPKALQQLKFFEQDLFNQLLSPLLPKRATDSKPEGKYKGFEGLQSWLNNEIREENQINSQDSLQRLRSLSPDLIVSIRYGGILKETCIGIPSKGVINLHSGILPKYRGVMATFWAMLNGEQEIGTTLHTISDGTIDTGEIIKVSKTPVQPQQSYLSQVLALYKQGAEDISQAILKLNANQDLGAEKQSQSDAYYSFPKLDDLKDFVNKGMKLVDEQAYLSFIKQHYL